MKIFDYWWYLYYRFSHYTCKRDSGDAKWIATLAISANFCIIIDTIIRLFLYTNSYDLFVKYWNSNIFLSYILAMPILSSIYFLRLRLNRMEELEKEYMNFSPKKRKTIISAFAFLVIIPILLIMFFIPYIRPT